MTVSGQHNYLNTQTTFVSLNYDTFLATSGSKSNEVPKCKEQIYASDKAFSFHVEFTMKFYMMHSVTIIFVHMLAIELRVYPVVFHHVCENSCRFFIFHSISGPYVPDTTNILKIKMSFQLFWIWLKKVSRFCRTTLYSVFHLLKVAIYSMWNKQYAAGAIY